MNDDGWQPPSSPLPRRLRDRVATGQSRSFVRLRSLDLSGEALSRCRRSSRTLQPRDADLRNNQLTALPPDLAIFLPNLRSLDARDNKLSALKPLARCVAALPLLAELDVRRNPLPHANDRPRLLRALAVAVAPPPADATAGHSASTAVLRAKPADERRHVRSEPSLRRAASQPALAAAAAACGERRLRVFNGEPATECRRAAPREPRARSSLAAGDGGGRRRVSRLLLRRGAADADAAAADPAATPATPLPQPTSPPPRRVHLEVSPPRPATAPPRSAASAASPAPRGVAVAAAATAEPWRRRLPAAGEATARARPQAVADEREHKLQRNLRVFLETGNLDGGDDDDDDDEADDDDEGDEDGADDGATPRPGLVVDLTQLPAEDADGGDGG